MSEERVSGEKFAAFSNAISDAVHEALESGMETDEAVCIGVAVMADYARQAYGPGYLAKLAKTVVSRAQEPLPADISRQ
jgi:hypothetical protein